MISIYFFIVLCPIAREVESITFIIKNSETSGENCPNINFAKIIPDTKPIHATYRILKVGVKL